MDGSKCFQFFVLHLAQGVPPSPWCPEVGQEAPRPPSLRTFPAKALQPKCMEQFERKTCNNSRGKSSNPTRSSFLRNLSPLQKPPFHISIQTLNLAKNARDNPPRSSFLRNLSPRPRARLSPYSRRVSCSGWGAGVWCACWSGAVWCGAMCAWCVVQCALASWPASAPPPSQHTCVCKRAHAWNTCPPKHRHTRTQLPCSTYRRDLDVQGR